MSQVSLSRSRYRLVSIGALAVIAGSLCSALLGATATPDYLSGVALLTGLTTLGPFAAFFITGGDEPVVWAMGVIGMGSIAANPLFPHPVTAVLTVLGFLAWFLAGLSFAYISV